MIHQHHQETQSTLLILSNQESDFLQLRTLLCTYFPSANKEQLHLDTKYYQADVRIVRQDWPHQEQVRLFEPSNSQQQNSIVNPDDKQDLLIMLADQNESFSPKTYDYVINKYNPENFILIVNTTGKLMPWGDQEKISNQVNNFIQIIKDNLEQLNKNPPERTKKGLLTDNYEDGNIFNLLQLIQTTPWSKISRKTFEKSQKAKPEPIIQQKIMERQAQKQQKKVSSQEEQQMTDEQLEKEMNDFEGMMKEMLNLRAQSAPSQKISDDQRKKKAQELMKKLVGGWM